MRTLLVVSLALSLSAPVAARQKFIDGLFMGTESGNPIELIAWAESQSTGTLRMANSSLEDAPVLPRTYRALLNMGSYDLIAVLAITRDVFSKPLDRLERRELRYSVTRLAVTTYEIGIPDLEDWDKIQRLRKNLKATPDNPMIVFLIVSNGANVRYYPFFIERN
jgi:hypothetical protein